jgi:phosphopantothenoylcysteine decarboxylase/phosphopantothenate--cysteine ligase
MCAAVADWRPDTIGETKLKKSETGLPVLALAENPDILASLGASRNRPRLLVGFAAETHNVAGYAADKLARKNCDWIVANNVALDSDIEGGVMGGDDNHVQLHDKNGCDDFGRLTKAATAEKLAARIGLHFETIDKELKIKDVPA